MTGMDEPTKTALDWLSYSTVVGAVAGILPSLATLLTILWLSIRVYESKTVQAWLKRKRD